MAKRTKKRNEEADGDLVSAKSYETSYRKSFDLFNLEHF